MCIADKPYASPSDKKVKRNLQPHISTHMTQVISGGLIYNEFMKFWHFYTDEEQGTWQNPHPTKPFIHDPLHLISGLPNVLLWFSLTVNPKYDDKYRSLLREISTYKYVSDGSNLTEN